MPKSKSKRRRNKKCSRARASMLKSRGNILQRRLKVCSPPKNELFIRTRVTTYKGQGEIIYVDNDDDNSALIYLVEHDCLVSYGHNGNSPKIEGRRGHCYWYTRDRIELEIVKGKIKKKEGNEMYEEFKKRIEEVKCWDKEADDILYKMGPNFMLTEGEKPREAYIEIPTTKFGNVMIFDGSKTEIKRFYFTSQCEKIVAFKKALMYLLDKSSIKKDMTGQEMDIEIDGEKHRVKIIS